MFYVYICFYGDICLCISLNLRRDDTSIIESRSTETITER